MTSNYIHDEKVRKLRRTLTIHKRIISTPQNKSAYIVIQTHYFCNGDIMLEEGKIIEKQPPVIRGVPSQVIGAHLKPIQMRALVRK